MIEVINDLVNLSNKHVQIFQEDYISEDGLLYCGRCKTPKQCRITIADKIFMPYHLCECENEKYQQLLKKHDRQEELNIISQNRNICFYSPEMYDWTFENDNHAGDEKIMNAFYQYAVNFEKMKQYKKGLLIYGSQGVGKSYGAACIANYLLDRNYTCMMTSFPRIINTISGMYENKQAYIDNLCNYDLLIIDDLASERETSYSEEIVMNVIDTRATTGLPIIITTNLTADELKYTNETQKQRIYSRLFGMTQTIQYTGTDRRKQKLVAENAEIKNILGL